MEIYKRYLRKQDQWRRTTANSLLNHPVNPEAGINLQLKNALDCGMKFALSHPNRAVFHPPKERVISSEPRETRAEKAILIVRWGRKVTGLLIKTAGLPAMEMF